MRTTWRSVHKSGKGYGVPVWIVLTLVVGEILAMAALLHLTGHSQLFALDNPAIARKEWQRHFPDDTLRQVLLGRDAALILTDQGAGLLRVLGADTIAHRIHTVSATPKGLQFNFPSFAAPPVLIRLSPAQSALWQQAMEITPNA